MKNHCIFLFALMLIMSMSNTGRTQVRLGAKAGLNLANQNWDGFGIEPDSKLLPTFMAGAVVEFDFSDKISLGTGLQYHGKGLKTEGTTDDIKYTLNYIQVPIQIQFRSNGFFGAVGPYMAYAIGGQVTEDGDSEDLDFGNELDDDYSSTDYGINVELGYEFGSLRATASYGLGLANGIPSDARDLFEDASIKNTVLGVALTYLFGGGGGE